MKKIVGIVALSVGILTTLAGAISLLIVKSGAGSNVSIIGGADGPTTIFLAGEVGCPMYGAVIGGTILVVIGILVLQSLTKGGRHSQDNKQD